MSKIIGIAGRKGSGKTTLGNMLYGQAMVNLGMIKEFDVTDKTELAIPVEEESSDGSPRVVMKGFNPLHENPANDVIWPYVKIYNLADPIKWICYTVFGVPYDRLYGSNKDKEKKLPIRIGKFKPWMSKEKIEELTKTKKWSGHITVRELMQIIGEGYRLIDPDIWINATMRCIKREKPLIAIIADVRTGNEAAAVTQKKGSLILSQRMLYEDSDLSETRVGQIDEDDCDIVVPSNASWAQSKTLMVNHMNKMWKDVCGDS